jgi:hypothetical protein
MKRKKDPRLHIVRRQPLLKAKAATATAQVFSRSEAPSDEDALPATTCLRCGMPGPHRRSSDCIASLRDALAEARNDPRERT